MEEKTYAYETNETNENILAKMKEDVKELREKVKVERKVRISTASNNRVNRNNEIKRIQLKLRLIKKEITNYNRSGLKEKDGANILQTIHNLIKDEVIDVVDMPTQI
jgi:hypothetical protein